MRTIYIVCVIALLGAMMVAPTAAQPANSAWPVYQHDFKHTGLSPYIGPETSTLKWVFDTDAGQRCYYSPTIGVDGIIYLSKSYGKDYDHIGALYAIYPNGTEKWNATSPGDDLRHPAGSPAIDVDGTIYVPWRLPGCAGKVVAYHPNGTIKWTFDKPMTDPPGNCYDLSWGPMVGPDGTIYQTSKTGSGYAHDRIYAINPDGTEKWTFKIIQDGFSCPVAVGSDGTIYAPCNDKNLYAIYPNGTEKWHFTTGDMCFGISVATDDTIYLASKDSNLYALYPNGTEKWHFTRDRFYRSPAIGSDGTIYVGSYDKNLYAVDPDGTEKWRFTTGDKIFCAPVIDGNGIIYVGSKDSKVYAINPDGTEKWHFEGEDKIYGLTIGPDGTIYAISYDGKLYAIGPGETPPPTPSTPFLILGDVSYDNGNPVLNPTVTVTNFGEDFTVKTSADSNFYLTLTDSDHVSEGNTIRINASDGTIYNEIEHTVTGYDMNSGGFEQDIPLEIPVPPEPDFTITRIALKTAGYVNEDNTLGVMVKNIGILDAGSFDVSLKVDGATLGVQTVPSLAAGASTELEYTWTPTNTGGHLLSATADVNNDVEESDETNNDLARTSVIIKRTDWHQFHYNEVHSGFSPSKAPNTNQTLWISEELSAIGGTSTVVADGNVFAYGGPTSPFGSGEGVLYCIDEFTGAIIWNISIPTPAFGSWSSPAYHNGRVFTSTDIEAGCYDAATGEQIWAFENPTNGPSVNGGPLVADGKVIVNDWQEGHYYCLDEETGELLWTFTEEQTGSWNVGYTQGVPAYEDGKFYLTTWLYVGGNVYCVDADTGDVIWNQTTPLDTCGSPAVVDGTVYVTNYNFYGDGAIYAMDASDGDILWEHTIQRSDSTPAVAYGNVYVTGGARGFSERQTYCFDAATGDLVWETSTADEIGAWTCSVAVADGKVFVGTEGGEFFDYAGTYALDAFTGDLIWSYPEGGSSPAIADDIVFTIGGGRVYAFYTESGPANLKLDIGNYSVAPGSTVTAPITLYGIQDYGTGTISVEYNPLVAHVTTVESSSESTVASYNIDNTSGTVRISAWNTNGTSGNVVFANVTLEAVGLVESSTALNLTVTLLQDISYSDIQTYTANGSFLVVDDAPPVVSEPTATPDRILNDNGRARVPGTKVSQLSVYVEDVTGVASVTANLTPIWGPGNDCVPMALTAGDNTSGLWSLNVSAAYDPGVNMTHCLAVNATDVSGNSNTTPCILLTVLRRGDVNVGIVHDNVVDMGDALYIARYTVGKESAPDPFVADVVGLNGVADCYNGVDMGDALYIARYTVGKEQAP